MNSKLTTIKSKLEAIASKKRKRLMGFKEWCETVWEPSKQLTAKGALLDPKNSDKLAPADLVAGAGNGGQKMERRRGAPPPRPTGRAISPVV